MFSTRNYSDIELNNGAAAADIANQELMARHFFVWVYKIVMFCMFFSNLFMVAVYGDELRQCSSIITPFVWMGLTAIYCQLQLLAIELIRSQLGAICDNVELNPLVFYPVRINILVGGAWMVIGAVVLWQDCSSSMPYPAVVLFWIDLMILLFHRLVDLVLFVKSWF